VCALTPRLTAALRPPRGAGAAAALSFSADEVGGKWPRIPTSPGPPATSAAPLSRPPPQQNDGPLAIQIFRIVDGEEVEHRQLVVLSESLLNLRLRELVIPCGKRGHASNLKGLAAGVVGDGPVVVGMREGSTVAKALEQERVAKASPVTYEIDDHVAGDLPN